MTERDGLVLEFINKFKLCTSEHIYSLFFNQVHSTVCKRRLRYLNENGYVERDKWNGNNYVYYTGDKPDSKLLAHDLLITDAIVKLINDGFEIVQFKKSFELGDIVSDAYIKIKKDNKEKNVLLEVQLNENNCLDKYKNIKQKVLDNTKWDVLPRLIVVGSVDQVDIPGVKISYLDLSMEGNILW